MRVAGNHDVNALPRLYYSDAGSARIAYFIVGDGDVAVSRLHLDVHAIGES